MARPANPDTPKKFVITLNAEGTAIDWSGFRDTTKDRFVSLVKGSDEVLAALDRPSEGRGGGANGSDSAKAASFMETNIKDALDLLGGLNALILRMGVAKLVKHPFKVNAETGQKMPFLIDADIATKAFTLTEAQHAELDPRLEKKLNELKLPGFLDKHLDWYLIGATYVKYCGENAKQAMGQQFARDLQLRGREQFLKNSANVKNPKPDSDAQRVSNFTNGHATQTPEEFPMEEQEKFPMGDMPSA